MVWGEASPAAEVLRKRLPAIARGTRKDRLQAGKRTWRYLTELRFKETSSGHWAK